MSILSESARFQDALFEGFEAYYNERVKENQYDITVEATVINTDLKAQGIYTVKTDNAQFDAYTIVGDYYKNDIVMVQIPNGDYNNPKYILSRKITNGEEYRFKLKFPFDNFIGLRRLEQDEQVQQNNTGYWANYPELKTGITEEERAACLSERQTILNTPLWEWTNNDGSTIGNTRLGLQADWKVLLGKYFPIRGNYGLRIVVKGVSGADSTTASTDIERTFYFTNRDMYGNVYAFSAPYTQQKVIDISEFLNINSIKIYFIQDFDFADNENKLITYPDELLAPPKIPPNISFSNLTVALGISAENLQDDTALAYTYDSMSYTGSETIVYDNNTSERIGSIWSCQEEKELHLSWVHLEPSDRSYSVIDTIEDLQSYRGRNSKNNTHIFWYRYNYSLTEDEQKFPNQDELTADDPLFRIYEEWTQEQNEDVDFESSMTRYGGVNWTFLPFATDQFSLTFLPRGDKGREKFKAVVQHNGTHTTSKEVIFKNTIDIDGEISSNNRNDYIVLKTFKVDTENVAKEDSSINAFYVYDENNKILTDDNGNNLAQQQYYLQVHVRNADTNKYEPLNTVTTGTDGKIITSGTTITWSFPQSYSMIKAFCNVNEYDAQYFGIDAQNEEERYQNFYNNTIKFTIQSTFNNRYLDNTIGALISRLDEEYYIRKEFLFGRAQGLGHEFLPVLEVLLPYGSSYLTEGSEFLIGCVVYNKDGSLYEYPSTLSFNWRELSGEDNLQYYLTPDSDQPIDGYQITNYTSALPENERDATYTLKYQGYRGNVIKARLKVSKDENGKDITKPPIFEVTVNNAASYPLTIRKGFMICNDDDYKSMREITVPNRIEFKSDGANPIYYSNKFKVISFSPYDRNNINRLLEYPEWKINNDRLFNLQETTVYGENNIAEGKEYSLKFRTPGNPQWSESLLGTDYYTYLYYNYYVPVRNSQGEIQLDSYQQPILKECYIAQALSFDRNYYSSSLVNDWDGTSLMWDTENGSILSTMIAAGSKDNNNKFTGVIMGDWHSKGDESLDTPGLYGYDKGEQSFGFRTDGTGFIGNAGKGRIEFDGNKALITNADQSCYINLNPQQTSLITTESLNSYSSNFLYCKVSKQSSMLEGLSTIEGVGGWSSKYFADTDNDYFIVDPNYGVVTTGGIMARYGKIGNWTISKAGLYQKDSANHKFMYLGYSSMDEAAYQEALNTLYYGKDDQPGYVDQLKALQDDYTKLQTRYFQEYTNRQNKAHQDVIDINELHEWYDLLHHFSIGMGLAHVRQFINTCLQQEKPIEYFKNNYQSEINNATDEATHIIYDESWNRVEHTNSGYSVTMTEILRNKDVTKRGIILEFTTFYGEVVNVESIKDNLETLTVEELEDIMIQCEYGYRIFEAAYQRQVQSAKQDYVNKAYSFYDYQCAQARLEYEQKVGQLNSDYNLAKAKLEENYSDGGQVYCIYAGQSEADFNQLKVDSDPYFSVTWDGTLYARKGKIAKTWEIDDTSLTYKKNNDKIYLGQGEKNKSVIDPAIEKIIYPEKYIYYTDFENADNNESTTIYYINNDNTKTYFTSVNSLIQNQKIVTADTLSANRWAISAGDNQYINFGVTQVGELYSQLGTIGGWKIDKNQLYAANGKMVFDSASSKILIGSPILVENNSKVAYPIMIDGESGLLSIVGTGNTDVTTGYLYLANFTLEAISSSGTWHYPISFDLKKGEEKTAGTFSLTNNSYDNGNSWGGGTTSGSITQGIEPLTYNLQEKTSSSAELTKLNVFKILNRESQNSYGIVIATGETANKKKTVMVYPTNCEENYPTLGAIMKINNTDTAYRWNIYANTIDCVKLSTTGVVYANNFIMAKEQVASQPWVMEKLEAIWKSLNSISSGVGSNAGSISSLGGALAKAALISLDINSENHGTGGGLYTLRVEGSTKTSEKPITGKTSIIVASKTHKHKLTIDSSAEDGKVSITIGSALNATTEHNTGSFNQADTPFFKKHAFDHFSYASSGGSQGIGKTGTIQAISKSGKTLDTTYVKLSTSGEGRNTSVKASCGDTTICAYSLSSFYDALKCTKDHSPQDSGITVTLNGTYKRYTMNGKVYYST